MHTHIKLGAWCPVNVNHSTMLIWEPLLHTLILGVDAPHVDFRSYAPYVVLRAIARHVDLRAYALLGVDAPHVDFRSLCSTRCFKSHCSTRWIESLCSSTLIGTTCILHSQVVVVSLHCHRCWVVVVDCKC